MIYKKVKIISNENIAKDIYQMSLLVGNIECYPGQFMSISLKDSSKILPRPFCIASYKDDVMTIIYQVVGHGTEQMIEYKKDDIVSCLFPLGNSHPKADKNTKVVLIGGGVGSVFFPYYSTYYKDASCFAYLGFANKDKVILENSFSKNTKVTICTDDGSYANKGYVTDYVLRDIESINPDIIIVCGPSIIYKILNDKLPEKYKNITYVSLEKRMGCGIGACLTCNCSIKDKSEVKQKRVCKDGPTFLLSEVVL